jgi:hypothetical protein
MAEVRDCEPAALVLIGLIVVHGKTHAAHISKSGIPLWATAMRKGFAVLIAFLLVMTWQSRKNMAAFFFGVGTLFAATAALTSDHVPDSILQALALGWALCTLIAGVSWAASLAARLRKKAKLP